MLDFIVGLVVLGFILCAAVFLFQVALGIVLLVFTAIVSVPVFIYEKIKEKIK